MDSPGEVERPPSPAVPVSASADWATQAVDMLEGVVDGIRTKTTEPITKAARALVYGVVLGVMGSVALVLVAITLVRVLDIAIPGGVWSAHLIVGLIFVAVGLVAWGRRAPKEG